VSGCKVEKVLSTYRRNRSWAVKLRVKQAEAGCGLCGIVFRQLSQLKIAAILRKRLVRSYFLRMPVSVLLKLFVASLAAGVSTALSCEVGG
jgi:hypothetical protein